jgi:PncC family amidohydrolase
VPEELIVEYGAVSEPVAVAMAHGVMEIAGAHIAVSITGVAGPDGTESKPPGTVFIALVTPGVEKCLRLKIPGNRKQVREIAVERALNLIIEVAVD